jgi:hypothetical protein
VTASASTSIAPAVATVKEGIVAPRSDGRGTLRVEFEGVRGEVPVEVRRASAIEPLRFRDDVLPVLTKAGCNTGKCHGAASGKDGFRLSLLGYDPEGDHHRLTREVVGRRTTGKAPGEAFILARFDKFTSGMLIIVRPSTPFPPLAEPAFNWVDRLVHAKLSRLQVRQSEVCSDEVSENVAQVFLGTRIQCAQCHNHPFDRWTMDDY